MLENKYEIGQIVFVKIDKEQKENMITAILIRPGGCISYELHDGVRNKWFYEFECSEEKDIVKATTE
jgi:hypothetical protein